MQAPDRPILLRYLSGEASPEEAALLDTWLNASPGNRQEFDAIWQLWQKTTHKTGYNAPDFKKDWQGLHARMQAPRATHSLFHGVRAGFWKVLTAIVAGGIVTGIILIKVKKDPPAHARVVRHSGGTILKDSVPDGTVIIMDAQSIFSYPSICQDMQGKLDTAFLTKGKVFIQTGAMPFVIRIADLIVRAGNSNFLLADDSATGVISIQVFRGIVEVLHSRPGSDVVHVQEGHAILYDRTTRQFTNKDSLDPNSAAFATGVFSFTNISLKELAAVLAKAYDVTIVLSDPAIGDYRMTGQFGPMPIKNVLDLLTRTLNITYSIQQQGKMIYLKSSGY